MGKLVDGVWHDVWYDTKSTGGKFVRKDSAFRNWVTPDGAPGPSGDGEFEAEAGRYHLYVSFACPWAHRTLIFRALKGLAGMIDVSVVSPYMFDQGWTFKQDFPGVVADPIHGADLMHQIYTKADPTYTGRVTVPVLWDKKRGTIVSNESSEIIRMFNAAFDGVGAKPGDYWPEGLRDEIESVNTRIYDSINNGVYKSGFATSQEAYDEAVAALFDGLDWVEALLSRQRYLVGDRITEADWRLFTTLIRFDPVYVGHFKCDKRRIVDYPNLWAYTRELYQTPGVAETVNMDHIRAHYYASHETINPTRIVPIGSDLDYWAPHGRDRLAAA
ncbi:MAG: glutathione S-transferase family protein [Alphaproteobacteria bacterium]|nr:glutathione S-transferase family protein [Alphaproteobacteria bacterium]